MLFLYLSYVEIFPRTPQIPTLAVLIKKLVKHLLALCLFLWVAASGHGDGTDPPLHGSSRIRNSVLKLPSFSSCHTCDRMCKPTLWP